MKDKRHFSGHNYTAVWFRRELKKPKELDLKITIFKSVRFYEHSVEAVPMFGLLVMSSPETDPFRLHPHHAKSFFITVQNRDAGQLITLIHHSHPDTSTQQEPSYNNTLISDGILG